jgi:nucleotide-binding universal stress UspA family protein
MKKILLPTDFSDNAENAIKYAVQLYKDEKCNFILLNTYTPIIYQVEHLQPSSPQLQVLEIVKETSRRKLKELIQAIKTEFNNPNHTFTQISAFNTLTAEINQLFEGNVMDMIVMGTKGASGLKEVLFGSNTVHVLKNTKCPVIAIPSSFTFETPHEILFPTDYEIDYQKMHLQSIIDISAMYNTRVNILHVLYENNSSHLQERNRLKLENYFKTIAYLFHDVKNQNIAEAITQFQLKARINLLVMINNKHSFFENLFFKSTINQIGFHLNIPFLVIPSQN